METVVRVAALYLFIMLGLRLLGKREFSQLSAFDLVTLILIPEIASQAMLREDFSVTNAVVGLSTLFLLVLVTSVLVQRSPRAARLVEGSPTVLVSRGAFLPHHMNRERVTPEEVYGEMHKVGLHAIEQVRWAILETDGRISIIPEARAGRQIPPVDRPIG